MITIDRAETGDIDRLVALGLRLFETDAAVHDSNIDLSWSERSGADDFRNLLADDSSLVLVARSGEHLVAYLVGYIPVPSPTRVPVPVAVLRSLYVEADHRGEGVGRRLVEAYVGWCHTKGCVEVQVSSYVANDRAQAFYDSHGFVPRSLTRVLPLQPPPPT